MSNLPALLLRARTICIPNPCHYGISFAKYKIRASSALLGRHMTNTCFCAVCVCV